jgi:transposase-like protein
MVDLIRGLSHPEPQVGRLLDRADEMAKDRRSRLDIPAASLPSARQLDATAIDEVVATYAAGATVHELAAQFGINRRTVGKHLRARDVDTRPPGLHPDDVPRAVELYRIGWSLAAIGEKFGTSANTVRTRLLEDGVQMRPRQGGRAR